MVLDFTFFISITSLKKWYKQVSIFLSLAANCRRLLVKMKARGKLESHPVHGVSLALKFPFRAFALTKTQAICRLALAAWAGIVRPVRGEQAVACK